MVLLVSILKCYVREKLPQISTDFHRSPYKSVEIRRNLWKSVEICRNP